MRAAVTEGPGIVTVGEVDPPPPAGVGEVGLRIERVGICGSDLHIYDGSHTYQHLPLIQGHEIVGVVDEIGPGVDGLELGTRVVADPQRACGHCLPCRRGRTNCCAALEVIGVHRPGGLQERLVVAAASVHRAHDLTADEAVFVEPLTIGIRAFERAGIGAGDSLLVLGAGSIGRSVVAVARDRRARVLVADHSAGRRELATRLGAEATSHIRTHDLSSAVAAFTGGDGVLAVIDTTGSGALLSVALDLVAPSGTVVVVGISREDFPVPVSLLSRKEISVVGSRNSIGAFPAAISLAARYGETLVGTIAERYPLSEADVALRAASSGGIAGKVVVEAG